MERPATPVAKALCTPGGDYWCQKGLASSPRISIPPFIGLVDRTETQARAGLDPQAEGRLESCAEQYGFGRAFGRQPAGAETPQGSRPRPRGQIL